MSSLGLARSRRVVPGPLLLALFYLLLQAPRIDAQFLTRAYALQRLSGVQNALFQIKLAERIVEGECVLSHSARQNIDNKNICV